MTRRTPPLFLLPLFLFGAAQPGCSTDSFGETLVECVYLPTLGLCEGTQTHSTSVGVTNNTTPTIFWTETGADSVYVTRNGVQIWGIRPVASSSFLTSPLAYGLHYPNTVTYTDSVPELTIGVTYRVVVKRRVVGDAASEFTLH